MGLYQHISETLRLGIRHTKYVSPASVPNVANQPHSPKSAKDYLVVIMCYTITTFARSETCEFPMLWTPQQRNITDSLPTSLCSLMAWTTAPQAEGCGFEPGLNLWAFRNLSGAGRWRKISWWKLYTSTKCRSPNSPNMRCGLCPEVVRL